MHPVRELLDARELLRNLTIRELKVRYKRSALGFLWTLLNPLLMMAVFTAVFSTFFKGMLSWFPIYFLTGYLPFAFFQASATVATGSIVGNGNLIRKVYFPRSVLPLSVVLAQLVHLLLGLGVLVVAETIIYIGWDRSFDWWWYLPLLVVAIALLTIFTAGLAMLLAAANTFLRDIQEFTTVAFLMWFYATPVIYPLDQLPGWVQTLIKLNPMTHFVEFFRDSLYSTSLPTWSTLMAGVGSALGMFVLGWLTFSRLSRDFAKEV
ncbi:MAG: ABC transporter permease [Acidimicrobiales bacterium]|nr:ABC transporter permease [Acidimicrobiales bacterium]